MARKLKLIASPETTSRARQQPLIIGVSLVVLICVSGLKAAAGAMQSQARPDPLIRWV